MFYHTLFEMINNFNDNKKPGTSNVPGFYGVLMINHCVKINAYLVSIMIHIKTLN